MPLMHLVMYKMYGAVTSGWTYPMSYHENKIGIISAWNVCIVCVSSMCSSLWASGSTSCQHFPHQPWTSLAPSCQSKWNHYPVHGQFCWLHCNCVCVYV